MKPRPAYTARPRAAILALGMLVLAPLGGPGCRPPGDPLGPSRDAGALLRQLQAAAARADAEPAARVRLGFHLFVVGNDVAAARAQFEAAWRAGDRSPETAFGLGETLFQTTQFAAALEPYEALLGAAPRPYGVLAAARLGALRRFVPPDRRPSPAALAAAAAPLAETAPCLVADLVQQYAGGRRPAAPAGAVGTWGRLTRLSPWPHDGFRRANATEPRPAPAEATPPAPAAVTPPARLDVGARGFVRVPGSMRGAFRAEHDWPCPATARYAVRLESRGSTSLHLDGRPLLVRDASRAALPRHSETIVALPAGSHRLALVFAATEDSRSARVRLLPLGPPAARPAAGAAPGAVVSRSVERLARAHERLARGAFAAAARDFAALAAEHPGSAPVALGLAEATRGTTRAGNAALRNRYAGALRDVIGHDPGLLRARYLLAAERIESGAEAEGSAIAQAAARANPQSPLWPELLFRAYESRGWPHEADAALERALALVPDDCRLIEARAKRWRMRPGPTPRAGAAELAACPGLAAHEARRLAERGRPATAARLWLGAVRPPETPAGAAPLGPQVALAIADLWLAAARPAEAVAVLEPTAAHHPEALAVRLRLAEALAQAGRPADAEAERAALLGSPAGTPELRHRLMLRGDDRFFTPFVQDAGAAAERARGHAMTAGADVVVVLDQQVSRYFGDGRSIHYVHVAALLLTPAGIEQHGEVPLPDGAELLHAATVKRNGERRVPGPATQTGALSMPALEPGDLIDYAFLVGQPAEPRITPEFLAPPFFFASIRAPILRSDFTLLVDHGRPVLVSPQGDTPTPERLRLGPLDGYRFIRNDSEQATLEPLALRVDHHLAGVRVASVGWADVLSRLADDLRLQLRPGPRLRRVARDIRARAATPAERAEAAFHWVRAHITERTEGLLEGRASGAAAAGEGERILVAQALFEALGVPADIVLVQPWNRAGPLDPVPDMLDVGYPVLRVDAGGAGPLWLDPLFDGAPLGYLPPLIRGRPGFVLRPAAAALPVVTPQARPEDERVDIRLTLTLAPDGRSASGEAHEVCRGIHAVSYRELLARADGAAQRELVRARLAAALPAVTVESLEIEGLREPEVPLGLRYRFRTTLRGAYEGPIERFAVGLYPEGLAAAYAGLAQRRTTFLLNVYLHQRVELRLVLPPTARLLSLPATTSLDTAVGTYVRVAGEERDASGATVAVVKKSQFVPLRLVTPREYPAVAAACRLHDEADRVTFTLAWPTPAATTAPGGAPAAPTAAKHAAQATVRQARRIRSGPQFGVPPR